MTVKEDNKYYTPSIEDFHVGFEYEIIPSIGFMIIDFENNNNNTIVKYATEFLKCEWMIKSGNLLGDGLPEIKAAIKDSKIRVKYLDKEDIENLLGTCEILSELHNNIIICLFKGNSNRQNKESEFQFYYNPISKWVLIYEPLGTRFAGFIKNISELKVLLKQLQII